MMRIPSPMSARAAEIMLNTGLLLDDGELGFTYGSVIAATSEDFFDDLRGMVDEIANESPEVRQHIAQALVFMEALYKISQAEDEIEEGEVDLRKEHLN